MSIVEVSRVIPALTGVTVAVYLYPGVPKVVVNVSTKTVPESIVMVPASVAVNTGGELTKTVITTEAVAPTLSVTVTVS